MRRAIGPLLAVALVGAVTSCGRSGGRGAGAAPDATVADATVPPAAAAPAVMDGVAVVSEGSTVSLRWSLPGDVFPDGGFVVTRTAVSGDGTPATIAVPSPLPADQSPIDADAHAGLVEAFDPAASADDPDGVAFLRAIVTLQAAVDPRVAEAMGTLIHDDDVEPGAHLRYEVATASGDRVGTAEIVVGSSAPLAAPTGLAATSSASGIDLVWDRPSEDSLVFAYHVEAAAPGDEFAPLTDDWTPLPPEDEGAESWFHDERDAGETVRYRVVGRDLFGRETPPSAEIVATGVDAEPLPQAYVVDSRSDSGDITLEWELADDPRVVGVQVLRTEDLEAEPEPVSELLDVDVREWTDADVQAGVDYHYAIAAVTADDRLAVGPLWTQRAINLEGPAAAANLRVEEGVDALTLSWDAPPDDDIGHYQVYAGRPGDDFDQFTLVGETTDTTFDVPVPEGTLLDLALRVRAVNTSDVSGAVSDEVTGRLVDRTPPSAPLWREATGVEGAVELSWVAALDPDVAAVRVLRAAVVSPESPDVTAPPDSAVSPDPVVSPESSVPDASGPVETDEREWEQVGDDLAPDVTALVDEDVEIGTGYDYVLVAVDASGNVSEHSEVRRAVPWSLDVAGAVDDLQAEVLPAGGVALTWAGDDDQTAGGGWLVSRWIGDGWVEISGLVDDPELVDERGAAGDRYRVTVVSPAGVLGATADVDTAAGSVPVDSAAP